MMSSLLERPRGARAPWATPCIRAWVHILLTFWQFYTLTFWMFLSLVSCLIKAGKGLNVHFSFRGLVEKILALENDPLYSTAPGYKGDMYYMYVPLWMTSFAPELCHWTAISSSGCTHAERQVGQCKIYCMHCYQQYRLEHQVHTCYQRYLLDIFFLVAVSNRNFPAVGFKVHHSQLHRGAWLVVEYKVFEQSKSTYLTAVLIQEKQNI